MTRRIVSLLVLLAAPCLTDAQAVMTPAPPDAISPQAATSPLPA
jgi:hypothetical protein